MSAADIIKPYLLEADRRKPHLKDVNTFASCGELLEDALALAGPDWQFIGKSGRKGEAGFKPAWFTPTWLELMRDDGQKESVLIDQFGMDAAWHMPSRAQVKVIANSTANELPIGDPRRGPAHLTPYMIDEFNPETHARQWRWWNPPMPQRGGTTSPPPLPPPGNSSAYPGDDVFDAVGVTLFDDYAAAGRSPNPQMGRWFGRTIYDWLAKNEPSLEASITKHRREWRAILGLPPS